MTLAYLFLKIVVVVSSCSFLFCDAFIGGFKKNNIRRFYSRDGIESIHNCNCNKKSRQFCRLPIASTIQDAEGFSQGTVVHYSSIPFLIYLNV